MSIIWTWQNRQTAKDFNEWLSQAVLPDNHQQAERAFREGDLTRWLEVTGDQASIERVRKACSLTDLLQPDSTTNEQDSQEQLKAPRTTEKAPIPSLEDLKKMTVKQLWQFDEGQLGQLDAAQLRVILLKIPSRAVVRRRYLQLRTPELLEQDRNLGGICLRLLLEAVVGLLVGIVGGAIMGVVFGGIAGLIAGGCGWVSGGAIHIGISWATTGAVVLAALCTFGIACLGVSEGDNATGGGALSGVGFGFALPDQIVWIAVSCTLVGAGIGLLFSAKRLQWYREAFGPHPFDFALFGDRKKRTDFAEAVKRLLKQ